MSYSTVTLHTTTYTCSRCKTENRATSADQTEAKARAGDGWAHVTAVLYSRSTNKEGQASMSRSKRTTTSTGSSRSSVLSAWTT